jgi:carbon storage regulator
MIGDEVEVTVLSVTGEKVRLGIEAPAHVPVHRTEIYREIGSQRETRRRQTDVSSGPDDSPGPLGGPRRRD